MQQNLNTENTRNYDLENVISAFNTFITTVKNSRDNLVSINNLKGLLDNFNKYFIVNAVLLGYNKEKIKDLMSLSEEKYEELIDEIEDEELSQLVENRINAYGGWEELEKHLISEEEFMAKLGITESDIENAEDVDLV
ncbi:MAG: hypothetical protein LBM93_10830 [Oscillospiraceae bacterium]|nr:hypothetical protein [Oscillospiraceae bacterium]